MGNRLKTPGTKGMTWWIGVVENRFDPEKMGRFQVRIFGHHSDNRDELPTNDLPWSPVLSVSPNITGIGTSPPYLVEGSWVYGFFEDGEDGQLPIIFGSVSGFYQTLPNFSRGFSDPNKVFPIETRIGEPDTHRLARGFTEGTNLETQNSNRVTEIPMFGGSTWDEPESTAEPVYPLNHVHQTESGYTEEIDNTPTKERYRQWHPSENYREIDASGNETHRINGNYFSITIKNKNVYIEGECNITVGGNANILCQSDANVQVDGTATCNVGENLNVTVEGDTNHKTSGNYTLEADGKVSIKGSIISLNES